MKPILFAFLMTTPVLAAEPVSKDWSVDGVKREALVVAPKVEKGSNPPLVFVFHGHGGTAKHAARTMPIHTHWPDAVCVYPQGLNTPGRITDPEGNKPGWQMAKGDQSDRDLKFFDAMFASMMADHGIDPKRVYCTGHSNGGAMTYLLWATRGDVFAALAPSASTSLRLQNEFKPKPLFHVMGEKDPLVPFAGQKMSVESVKKVNGVEATGKPWHDVKYATVYESKSGTPVVTYVHPGTHNYPEDAPKEIARFFKEHPAENARAGGSGRP